MIQAIEKVIENRLREAFNPIFLSVENDSYLHQGPRDDSHFKVLIVSEQFEGDSPVKCHQKIYRCLGQDVMNRIHALQLNAWTEEQWKVSNNKTIPSSQCNKSQ